MSRLSLSDHVGVVSERFQDALENYIQRNPRSVLTDSEVRQCVDVGCPVAVAWAASSSLVPLLMFITVATGQPGRQEHVAVYRCVQHFDVDEVHEEYCGAW